MPKSTIQNPAIKCKDLDSITKHKCGQCLYWSLEKFRLKRHVKIVHQKLKKCPLCDFLSGSKLELKHHLDTDHENKMVFCMHCSYSTRRHYKPDLEKHIKKVHEQIFDEFCDRCDSSFSNIQDLRNHQKKAHKEGIVSQGLPLFIRKHQIYKFKCEKCPFSASHSTSLKSHLLKVHQVPICLNCNYRGKDYEDLRNHCLKIHESMYNIDPTTCHLCTFSAHSSLSSTTSISKTMIHIMAVHGGEHPCPTCNKNFKEKRKLKEHINKSHMKKLDLSCQVCDTTFGAESSLRRHMKRKKHIENYEKSLTLPLPAMKFQIEDMASPESTQNQKKADSNLCCPVITCLLQFSHINEVNIHLWNDHNME